MNDSTTKVTNGTIPSWIPPNIYKYKGDRVQVKLLCGADLLESFATPGLWCEDDVSRNLRIQQQKQLDLIFILFGFVLYRLTMHIQIEAILSEHGIVVISRSGNNPERFIFESDLLTKYKKKINIVTNWVPNEVSSTLARRQLRRGLSVKYMLDDYVVEYIRQHRLYAQDSS